jgi:hypothetical protein
MRMYVYDIHAHMHMIQLLCEFRYMQIQTHTCRYSYVCISYISCICDMHFVISCAYECAYVSCMSFTYTSAYVCCICFRHMHICTDRITDVNALLQALKATGVGHCTISGLLSPASGFGADLAIVARSAGDLSRLLRVVADFCAWSGMRIKREKSVITGFDFRLGTDLPTAGILYEGAPPPSHRLGG